jgi:very-short-patch-repair endonuclease
VYGRQSRAFNQRPAVGSGEAGRKSVNYSKMVLEQLVAAGLPEPALEFFFAKDDLGREWRADLAYPSEWILIEIEGGTWVRGRHSRGAGYEGDCEKYDVATLMGYRVYRFTSNQVKRGIVPRVIKVALGLAPLTGEEFKTETKRRRKKAE